MRAPGQRQLGPVPLLLGATSQVKCLQTVVPLCPALLSSVCMPSPSALSSHGQLLLLLGGPVLFLGVAEQRGSCLHYSCGAAVPFQCFQRNFPKCLHLALLPRGHFLLSRTKRRDWSLSWCPLLFPVSSEPVWMSRLVPGCLMLPAEV